MGQALTKIIGCRTSRIVSVICNKKGEQKSVVESPQKWMTDDNPSKVKTCSNERCTNNALKGGLCQRHCADFVCKQSSATDCTKQAVNGGVCQRHGGTVNKKPCSHEGCANNAQEGGVCVRHGAKVKSYNHEGCTKNVQQG